ncbi:hypothetical protein BH18THE2_BH18THE2_25230 [soil metagenome]
MTKDNGFVAISINDSSVSYPPNAKLFCNLCNCNLSLLDAEKEEWICTRCNVSYFPNKGEKVKRANRFQTPGPETDKHGNIVGEKMPLVSIVQDNKELSSAYGKEKLPKSFEEMQRHGVKITSYTTTEDR